MEETAWRCHLKDSQDSPAGLTEHLVEMAASTAHKHGDMALAIPTSPLTELNIVAGYGVDVLMGVGYLSAYRSICLLYRIDLCKGVRAQLTGLCLGGVVARQTRACGCYALDNRDYSGNHNGHRTTA